MNTLIQGLNRELLDWIPLKGSNQFTLCVSHCPGKYGSHSTKTQIQKDLKFLKNNNIQLIVSLLLKEELTDLGLEDLFCSIRKFGFEHIHFPINDRSTPEDISHFEELIFYLEEKIKNQGVVHIHCNAGLGRSGLLAALICKKLNISKNPIEYIRKFRKGAIETKTQENMITSLFN